MLDVLVAGAGPAGSIAALVLARAGARVLVVDRDAFPREKLCGDTLNPGAVRRLASLGLTGGILDRARPLAGMIVTGRRTAVRATYGDGVAGLSIRRRDLDAWLLDAAIQAGAHFEPGCVVKAPLVDASQTPAVVRGVTIARRDGGDVRLPASLTIAADGRRSGVARALGLARDPERPRRYAFGIYLTDVADVADLGEMHIREGWYLGLAPMPDGATNLCFVTDRPAAMLRAPRRRAFPQSLPCLDPDDVAFDAPLARRLTHARVASELRVLGPLAVDVRGVGAPGLLLAGDAAGFVDPMTGDGLHLAIESGIEAAEEALRTLESGDVAGAPARLARTRRRTLGRKLRFNRMLRRLVSSPLAVDLAGAGAVLAPGWVRRAIRFAGDAA